MPQGNAQKEKIKELTDMLERGVKDVFQSDQYKKWLDTCAKFHTYSINNQILIGAQMPSASMIAGYTTWKSMSRYVKRKETGLRILCPAPLRKRELVDEKDPITGQVRLDSAGNPKKVVSEVLIPRYKIGYVWDISQTEGKELPTLVTALDGSVNGYNLMKEALEKVSPVPISVEPIQGSANGFYHLEDKRIVVKEGMSEQQTIKTMIHEITHSALHDPDLDPESRTAPRAEKEIQAESVAYVVCQYYGIDSSQYSFGYVGSWSEGKDLSQLKKSMETIRRTAGDLIDRIDKELYPEKIKDKAEDNLKEMGPGTIGKAVFQKKDLDREPVLAKPRRR